MDAVLGGDLFGFPAVAGDEGGGAGVFGFAEGGEDLIEREVAEADDGVAGALLAGFKGGRGFLGGFGGGVERWELDGVGLVGPGRRLPGERGGGKAGGGEGGAGGAQEVAAVEGRCGRLRGTLDPDS